MKFYDTKLGPNPRRVRIFLAEKGIDIPKVEVDLGKMEQKGDDYTKINPLQRTPALERTRQSGHCPAPIRIRCFADVIGDQLELGIARSRVDETIQKL